MFRMFGYGVQLDNGDKANQLFASRTMAEQFCQQNGIDVTKIVQLYNHVIPAYVEPKSDTAIEP